MPSSDPHSAATNINPKCLLFNAASGASAGVIAATFVCPLDVIKTRFQVHGVPQLANGSVKGSVIFASLQQIFHKEGLRGMYRGLAPTVLALLPNWAIFVSRYFTYTISAVVTHSLSIMCPTTN
ncbi:hypothetical protein TSUD_342520 [Trifolium subterraneum]|nr:hypothetical protein TSUD_342520 [Trifolium subterraneum]